MPFVHDIYDLLWAIPADNPGATELSEALLANMDTSLRLADLVTASTEPLAAALERRGIPAVIYSESARSHRLADHAQAR